MSKIAFDDVKKLLEEIEALRYRTKEISRNDQLFTEAEAAYYTTVGELYGADDRAKRWDSQDEEQQARVYDVLTIARNALSREVLDKERDKERDKEKDESQSTLAETGIMAAKLAPDWMVIGLTILAIAATTAALWQIYTLWPSATRSLLEPDSSGAARVSNPSEANVLLMVILMGALGGLLHSVSSLGMYVGNRQFYRSWIVYYLLMPLEGAALAPMIYLVLRVGILAPAAQNEATTANLNEITLYGFAGMAGLFAKQAMEMLRDIFNIMFRKISAKDGLKQDEQEGKTRTGDSTGAARG